MSRHLAPDICAHIGLPCVPAGAFRDRVAQILLHLGFIRSGTGQNDLSIRVILAYSLS